jgi:lysophospholipase L1-like esterase
VTFVELAIAAVLVLASSFGPLPEALGLVGVGVVFVSGGAFVSEWRYARAGDPVRGPILLGLAFVLLAGALILLPTGGWLVGVLLLGAVSAELGTELYSADRLRQVERRQWAWATLGIGLLAASAGLLMAGGAGWFAALVVVTVVFVVVWMAASDSDSLVLVLIIALVLLAASAPRDADPNPEQVAVRGKPFFLVLGDSYISGEGADRFYKGTNTTQENPERTNQCRRAPTAWPVLLTQSDLPNVPNRMLFLGCSGALAHQIRTKIWMTRKDGETTRHGEAELVEYQARRKELNLDQKPAFVLLSVGGNDAGFGSIGQACVGPGDCSELGDVFLDGLRTVEPKLDVTYRDVRRVVGADVPVIVVPYPIPITESGACPNVFLSTNERHFVVRFVEQLDQVVKSAAERAGFYYMGPAELALKDAQNRLCEGADQPGLNFIGWNPKAGSLWDSLNPANWVHNSLHPNQAGHQAIFAAARKWFESHPTLHVPDPSGAPRRVVPTMASLFKFGSLKLCGNTTANSCDVKHRGWLYDQSRRLFTSVFLALVLAAIGAWLMVQAPIRWATEHKVTSANVVRRLF